MALQTTALENTSIKVGPARKTKHRGKMARRSKRSKRRDNHDKLLVIGQSGEFGDTSRFVVIGKIVKAVGVLDIPSVFSSAVPHLKSAMTK
ncbi:unnamed protein product [Boreogadus saida]